MGKLHSILRLNWFYPLALLLVGGVWALSMNMVGVAGDQDFRSFELALLIDIFVTLPMLFWLCFRLHWPAKRIALGLVATICTGLWLATWIIPAEHQQLIGQIGWLRYVGLTLLLIFEVGVVIAVIRMIWNPKADTRKIEAMGVPPFVAKLMLAEARFWRWIFSKFRK